MQNTGSHPGFSPTTTLSLAKPATRGGAGRAKHGDSSHRGPGNDPMHIVSHRQSLRGDLLSQEGQDFGSNRPRMEEIQ